MSNQEQEERKPCGDCGYYQIMEDETIYGNICECGASEEEEHEYEYENCGTEKEPLFGELSYMVAGGGMMNGNAYATIELKDGIYYYCEYGKNASRQAVGNKIVWSDEIYDKKNPYECRQFDILDIYIPDEEDVKLLRLEDGEEDCCVWCFPCSDEEFNQFQDKICKKCLEEELHRRCGMEE